MPICCIVTGYHTRVIMTRLFCKAVPYFSYFVQVDNQAFIYSIFVQLYIKAVQ